MKDLKIQMQPVGQAQVWRGEREAVLWECYLHETARATGWQEELAAFWRAVEKDIAAPKIFTQPQEPTFPEGYQAFLRQLVQGEVVRLSASFTGQASRTCDYVWSWSRRVGCRWF